MLEARQEWLELETCAKSCAWWRLGPQLPHGSRVLWSRVPQRAVPGSLRPPPRCADGDFGQLLYTNSVVCISEIHSEFSDSIQFMQIHTEFRYDPPQGQRACEGRPPRVGRCWQPSYKVPNSVHFEAQKLGVPALVPCNNSCTLIPPGVLGHWQMVTRPRVNQRYKQ